MKAALPLFNDLTVVICTRNRSESLAVTLESLATADRSGVRMEVRVVDNGSSDNTGEVVAAFSRRLPLSYLLEPTVGVYGKSHALNAAIRMGGLGELVAVLDDDISVREDWVQAVCSVSRKWEGVSVFGGTILVSWPVDQPPAWALDPRIHSWLFSALDYGTKEKPLAPGQWFSGNHFWFRSWVLEGGRRFRDIWLTEPDFILQLVDEGHQGLASPDAVVWHRVQPQLLDPHVARTRARLVGRSFARVRTQPPRKRVKQSFLLGRHPFWGRLFCVVAMVKWRYRMHVAALEPNADRRLVLELLAVERFYNYREILAAAEETEQYNRGFPARAGSSIGRLATRLLGQG